MQPAASNYNLENFNTLAANPLMQESRASGSGNSATSGHKSQKRIYGSELGSPNAHGFNFFVRR